MRAMSGFLALAAMGLLASACAPTMRWDKPGSSAEALQADQVDCRKAAADEAFRNYAFFSGFGMMGAPFWGYRHQPDYFLWRQRLETDRAFQEMRLANFCMRNKGYTQVPINEQTPAK
jgi:hypothetical protein